MKRTAICIAFGLAVLVVPVSRIVAQQPTEHIELNVIHKIKAAEGVGGGGGFGRGGGPSPSQVMETMYYLTDRYGPRLTNSPQFRAAGEWAVTQLKEWGLSNVHLEKWSTAGGRGGAIPGWQFTGFSAAMVEPSYMPIIGYPQAWTSGTQGPVTGEAMLATIQTPEDLAKWHGKLKGKIVLTAEPPELPFPDTPLGHRYTDAELSAMIPDLLPAGGRGGRGGQPNPLLNMTPEERQAFLEKQRNFHIYGMAMPCSCAACLLLRCNWKMSPYPIIWMPSAFSFLTYDGMKPLSPETHAALADWVAAVASLSFATTMPTLTTKSMNGGTATAFTSRHTTTRFV